MFDFLVLWKNALLHPRETFEAEKQNASTARALEHLIIAGIFGATLSFLFILAFVPSLIGAVMALFLFAAPVFVAFGLITNAIVWGLSKLLGGQGDFKTQFYIYSLFASPLLSISLVLWFAISVGLIYFIVVFLLVVLFFIYLGYFANRAVQNLSRLKAFILVIPSTILAFWVFWLIMPGFIPTNIMFSLEGDSYPISNLCYSQIAQDSSCYVSGDYDPNGQLRTIPGFCRSFNSSKNWTCQDVPIALRSSRKP